MDSKTTPVKPLSGDYYARGTLVAWSPGEVYRIVDAMRGTDGWEYQTSFVGSDADMWCIGTMDSGVLAERYRTRADAVSALGFCTPYSRRRAGKNYEYLGESYSAYVGRVRDMTVPEPAAESPHE